MAPFVQGQGRKPLASFLLRIDYFLVCEMMFLVFATGSICVDVQKSNALEVIGDGFR